MKEPSPKILVVDDEPRNIRVLQILLEAKGYTVVTATHGEEALDHVKAGPPDLILLDIMMPRMNGFEVCQQIRADEDTQFVPIVMVTALTEAHDRIKAIEVGADDFISKPFDSYEIIARARSLLRVKEYHDALKQANEKLAEHNARLDMELQMAQEVQASLMPQRITNLAGFQVVSHYSPEIAVGGDFFDLWEVGPGKLGVLISDVMGHGVPAAFVTVFIKTIVEEMREQTDDPGQILEVLNTRFDKSMSLDLAIFATAFCGVIDQADQTLRWANAGHPFPFLIRRGQRVCETVGNQSIGEGLGILSDSVYQTFQIPFKPSDGLFLYTDGAHELQNTEGEEFSPERLQDVLVEQSSHPATVLVDSVVQAIDRFNEGIPREDDITIVAIDANADSCAR